jgi:L-malate glycosyltransferase
VSQKIKILHLIKSLGRGGAEMLLPETLKLHNQDTFEFHYIYFLPWKNQLVKDLESAGGKVHCFAARHNLSILWQYRKIITYIKSNNIDLLHAHLPWAGFVARLVKKFYRIPLIYTEHNKQERYHKLTYWLNRFSFNSNDLVLAVSADVAFSIYTHIAPKIPVQVLHNGVNTQSFQRDENNKVKVRATLGMAADAKVVGLVAVFRFQKRIAEWLEIFAAAQQQLPELRGIIVGNGPLRKAVEDKRKELNLQDKVFLVGLQEDMKPWYDAMDVFMMSSEFEGLPVSMLEAMSMECAIVTTDAGGIKELIEQEQNGLMVGVHNWQRLSEQLLRVCQDDALRLRLAQAARKTVVEKFSMQQMVKSLEEIYRPNDRSREEID